MPTTRNDSAPPGAPPKTPLELVREVVQIHYLIASALNELTELMQELSERLEEGAS